MKSTVAALAGTFDLEASAHGVRLSDLNFGSFLLSPGEAQLLGTELLRLAMRADTLKAGEDLRKLTEQGGQPLSVAAVGRVSAPRTIRNWGVL